MLTLRFLLCSSSRVYYTLRYMLFFSLENYLLLIIIDKKFSIYPKLTLVGISKPRVKRQIFLKMARQIFLVCIWACRRVWAFTFTGDLPITGGNENYRQNDMYSSNMTRFFQAVSTNVYRHSSCCCQPEKTSSYCYLMIQQVCKRSS